MPISRADVAALTPKTITNRHFLSKATAKAAKSLQFGGEKINLEFEPERPQFAVVKDFKLSRQAAEKLSRKTNLLEGVATPIRRESDAEKKLRDYMAKVKVSEAIAKNSSLYLVSVRRRNPSDSDGSSSATGRDPSAGGTAVATRVDTRTAVSVSPDMLRLTRELPIATEQHFVLGLSLNEESNLVAAIIHPDYRYKRKLKKGGVTVVKLPPASDPGGAQPAPEPDAQEDPDNTQDFAKCYGDCLKNVPDFLLALAGAVCATCATTIAVAAGTAGGGGTTATAVAIACTACGVTIGIILGNCLLTCHEML